MRKKAVSMEDVAKAAGVSKMTVSRVLNQPSLVSPITRAHVEAAMAALSYVAPNRSQKRPKTTSGLIALLVTDLTNPFFTNVAMGVEDVAYKAGYTVVLCNSDEQYTKEYEFLQSLVMHKVDGAILVPANDNSKAHLRILDRHNVPFVLCDRRLPGVNCDMVVADSVTGAKELTKHLIEQGYRRIAFIGAGSSISTSRERQSGYATALKENGIPVDPDLIVNVGYRTPDGATAFNILLDRGRKFDSIVAANNALALGIAQRARDLGLSIPKDFGLVCFDEASGLYGPLDPFFTVAAQPAIDFGTIAAQMLIERIEGKAPKRPREVILMPKIIVRKSSTPLGS
jgi:LacI family transcriptional regulator